MQALIKGVYAMKKAFTLSGLYLLLFFCGCSKENAIRETFNGNIRTYYELHHGTWKCDDQSYKYRLEISGRLHNAAKDTAYVYLSNIKNITFDQAWKAGGLSSSMDDYFSPEEAVLVEMK